MKARRWFVANVVVGQLIIVALIFGASTQVVDARFAPNARRAVVLEAFYALRTSHDGSCDKVLPDGSNRCVSTWNYLASDMSAYNKMKSESWYGCKYASVWEKSTDPCIPPHRNSGKPYSYYTEVSKYGLNNYSGYTFNIGRGGQCKYFANLITYRSGTDTNLQPGYADMTKGSLLLNTAKNLAKVKEGDILFVPDKHTAIVVEIKRSSGLVSGLDVIDSNYVGGAGSEIIGRHNYSSSTLINGGYRIWTGVSYYNTNYDPNSHY